MDRRYQALQYLLVLATIAVTLTAVWLWAARHNYIPCISDCGETFIAQLYARNFRLFGFEFGLVEDHATSPSIDAHPYHYTHNVNIGGLYYVLLELLGANSFVAKQFFVLLIFGLGLSYAYAAVAVHTKSRLAGYCVLVAACLDFGFFLGFALHALRVWTWLALFGLLLHVGRFAEAEVAVKRRDVAGVLAISAIAFGIGYEFWIISVCVALATFYFFTRVPSTSWPCIRRLGLLLLLLLTPFVLRQFHILAVLGTDYWAKDFFYTFGAKIPFAGRFLALPPPAVVDQFYQAHNIMRPPTAPIDSVGQFKESLLSLKLAFIHVILPLAGLLGVVLTTVAAVAAVVIALIGKARPRHSGTGIDLSGAAKLLAALSVGLGVGCLVMLRMVVPFYFAMGMPLLGALVVLAKGMVVGALIGAAKQRKGEPAWAPRWVALPALLFLAADHGLIQAANVRASRPMDTSWIPVVSARPNATYAVTFIAPVVAGFTSNWTVGIKTGREREMLETISKGGAPFQRSDLFWFGERDAEAIAWAYLKPDYWLYFPIDRRASFFSIEPECRADYLSRLLGLDQRETSTSQGVVRSSWIQPNHARPGATILVGLKLRSNIPVQEVSFSVDGKTFAEGSVNCITNFAIAQLRLPEAPREVRQTVVARISLRHRAQPVIVGVGEVRIDPSAVQAPPPYLPRPQPSIAEVLSAYPALPIRDRRVDENPWQGYVLIDLRAIHGRDPRPK